MTPCSELSGTRRFRGTSGTTQRSTRRHIPEEDILQNHRCENLKSYVNQEHYHYVSGSIQIGYSIILENMGKESIPENAERIIL
jgi:hypothetical protein